MAARIVTWSRELAPLGKAVVAIGVFDGVHIGHASLLRETVADAAARAVRAIAVTFDRDPDQVVSPESAAPQLLTLEAKLAAISRSGVDVVLVVPFTADLAEMDAESFLDVVLLQAIAPLAVHVGSDFRFGHMALGDVGTLQRFGAIRGFDVAGHDLVTVDGEAVTSTRIRAEVAAGHIDEAICLLGGKPCVTGTVHRGRGEGAGLGFPTANVVPVPFAALPGDGVYAGRATIADGTQWAAAISVGTPPSFPEARDYLEAHLIDFDGDLYDQPITLEFWARLRDQLRYDSLDALKAAIAADAQSALDIAGFTDEELAASGPPDPVDPSGEAPDAGADGADVVVDPAALEAAEQAAMHAPGSWEREVRGEWVTVASRRFSILAAAPESFQLAAPLEAAGIPFCWSPYPPDQTPAGLRGAMTAPFDLQVPADRADAARDALDDAERDASQIELPADDEAFVDDPAALEAAERAAQAYREPEPDRTEAPEDWVEILSDTPFQKERFQAIDAALTAEGIDHIWEPYAPEQAPLLRLSFWDTERFSISVPESLAEDGAAVIGRVDDENADHW